MRSRQRALSASGQYQLRSLPACSGRCRKLPVYMEKFKGLKYYQVKLELYALVTEILNIDVSYGISPDYEKISDLMCRLSG